MFGFGSPKHTKFKGSGLDKLNLVVQSSSGLKGFYQKCWEIAIKLMGPDFASP